MQLFTQCSGAVCECGGVDTCGFRLAKVICDRQKWFVWVWVWVWIWGRVRELSSSPRKATLCKGDAASALDYNNILLGQFGELGYDSIGSLFHRIGWCFFRRPLFRLLVTQLDNKNEKMGFHSIPTSFRFFLGL